MFRQAYNVLVATITVFVLVDSRTVHREESLGIIGGQEATPHEVPSVVRFLMYKVDENGQKVYYGGACGGALISDKYVLTAKHCAEDREGSLVFLGMHDSVNNTDAETQLVDKSKFIEHPQVDLLLVELNSPVTFNDKINKTSLPLKKDVNKTYFGENGTAYCWGLTSPGGEGSRNLKKVENLTVIPNSQCTDELKTLGSAGPYSYEFCTSGNSPSDPRGVCGGDSGGPFYIDNVLVGVIVRVAPKCAAGGPSLYISTGLFLKWIGDNTGIDLP